MSAEIEAVRDDVQTPTKKGIRVAHLSFTYKCALSEAFHISRISERKFAHTQAILLYTSLEELHHQGLMKERVSLETV